MIEDQLFFQMMLLEIKGKCISHAFYKEKERAMLETEIITDVKRTDVKRTDVKRTLKKTMYSFWNKKDKSFRNKTEKVDGMIRSHTKWIGDGEKNQIFL